LSPAGQRGNQERKKKKAFHVQDKLGDRNYGNAVIPPQAKMHQANGKSTGSPAKFL
jgi:hypothetical protein